MKLKKTVIALIIFALCFSTLNLRTRPAQAESVNRPLVIWAWEDIDIDEALNIYDPGSEVLVSQISPDEMNRRLEEAVKNDSDYPDIMLVNDDDIKKYVEKYPDLFNSINRVRTYEYMDYKSSSVSYSNGTTYGIPYSCRPAALYYRYDIAQEVGIENMDDLTMDEFIDIGRRVYENSGKVFPLAMEQIAEDVLLKSTGAQTLHSEGTLKTLELIDIKTIASTRHII